MIKVFFIFFSKGVEQDETNIQDFFKDKLNFRCTLLRDSTKDELLEKLDKTKSELNENAAQYYCFILFLMGHGTQVLIQ